MRSTGIRKTSGSSRSRCRVGLVSATGLLEAQDLGERRATHVELLGGRLTRREQALHLEPRAVEGPRKRAVGVALRPREELNGQSHARERDADAGEWAPQLEERAHDDVA